MTHSAIDVASEIRSSRTEQRFRMTYEEYRAWVDEDTHSEWVNGEAIVFVPPLVIHQRISQFLASILNWYVRKLNLGEVIVIEAVIGIGFDRGIVNAEVMLY